MKTVYLGLGANLGNREEALQTAVSLLHREDLVIRRLSSVYETAPRDYTAQHWFLNMAVEAETSLLPMRLLLRTSNIERQMGRKRTGAVKGPRVIDIDILLFGAVRLDTPQLQIPHPRLLHRRFALEPLCDLAPDLRHPGTLRSLREHLAETMSQAVRRHSFQPVLPAQGLHL